MALPLKPPIEPQLALSRKQIPADDGWVYEPKYDGFRAIAFVDGAEVFLQSRSGRPLARYFPELEFPEGRYVIDGELLILDEDGHEVFDALQNRLHPAESRVQMLAEKTPALFRAFDLLAIGDESALGNPFTERRAALEKLVAGFADPGSVELTPLVDVAADAEPWLETGEGVIAKKADSPYLRGERKAMVKIKRLRTIDAVVAGWRPGKEENTVGSLMLGLYDPTGELHVVGHTSGLKAKEKRELVGHAGPVRDRRARLRRPEPLVGRPRPRVGRAAARARDRGQLRPRQRRPDPPRREDRSLARRQAALRLPARAAGRLAAAPLRQSRRRCIT